MKKKTNSRSRSKTKSAVLDVDPIEDSQSMEPIVDNSPSPEAPPPTLSVDDGTSAGVFFPEPNSQSKEDLPQEVASFDPSQMSPPQQQKNQSGLNWHAWFMQGVYWVSTKSKDPMTKIGSLLVKNNRIISTGYNGIPIGVNDSVQVRNERPEKYKWYEHAERNAIYSAARHGISTEGSILYTNALPCIDCARAIIQAGMKEVYIHKQFNELCKEANREQWTGHEEVSHALFTEAGVMVYDVDGQINCKAIFNGKVYDV